MSTVVAKPSSEIAEELQGPSTLFCLDIEAMSDEMLRASPGGKARCGYDLLFEVTEFNEYVAAMATGREGALKNDGWAVAPDSFKDKEQALMRFKASVADLGQALREISPEQYEEPVETPFGLLPVSRLASIVPRHIMYHSGQLNYIQTIFGDAESHWW